MSRRTQVSAGLLAFRRTPKLEVLLVHPGGPFWAGKDRGAWSIPKGLVESGDLLKCARREFTEETGLAPGEGPFTTLRPVRQKNGKTVHAFAFESDFDLTGFASNDFEMEWPPRSGRIRRFPEADRAAYVDFEAALDKIHGYQKPLLEELEERLRG
jgi:predicted NUDIX family NTP pyrophosphohydrolase